MNAFQTRTANGMNLSRRVWNLKEQYQQELEMGLSVGIEKGTSAAELAKELKQYLQNPDKLFRRVRNKFGNLKLSQNAKAYHPGSGVYRSSYKNALRLTRSEANMAYRTAKQTRWRQFDFVVGYEIKLSKSHPCHDVCDTLAGKYPKTFRWTGWHPMDMCYCVSILKTDDEFWSDSPESEKEVKDVPDTFKQWVLENRQKINKAQKKNTLPYFLKDNESVIQNISIENSAKDIVNRASFIGNEVQKLAEYIAKKDKGFVTPINYKSISSIIRKATTEGITPYDIKDGVRTTIIVPKSQIDKILKELSESESFVRMKRQKAESFMGYSGNIVNIKTSNGLIAEIQVNTEQMIYAKEKPEDAKRILWEKRWEEIRKQTGIEGGLGHKYYEEWRVLDKADKKAQKIAKKSIEYYSHFQ